MVLRRIETMIQKNQYLTEKSESETVVTEQEQSSLKPDTADQQDSVPNFGTEQMASAENERIRVAIESSEDVEERDIGFLHIIIQMEEMEYVSVWYALVRMGS